MVSAAFIESSKKLAASVIANAGRKTLELLSNIEVDYGAHLAASFERCTKIKTILNRDEPVDLLSQYVGLKFSNSKKDYDDIDVIDQIWAKKKIVISGTGGGGKTIFMKYLWLSFFENPKGRIPVLVELRRFNDIGTDDLTAFVHRTILGINTRIELEKFHQGIRSGHFIFLFDGFDELNHERRSIVEEEILRIASMPESIVIVSGRPDPRFDSWQLFTTFKVLPLEKRQVVSLIQKINYDKKVKAKFIDRIKKDLYDSHQSFLSSPLLATMMLLTFDQFADIPEKVHLFYEQAFDTLFAKHDATKEAYKRKTYTDLPIDVFKRILSFFCLFSYFEEKYELSEIEAIDYLGRSIKMEGANIKPHDLLKDLLESVCVLQPDGTHLSFTHRSFQEYFSAYCLSRLVPNRMEAILPRFMYRPEDNVISMCFDMTQELFEREFILPKLECLLEELDAGTDGMVLYNYLKVTAGQVLIQVIDDKRASMFMISNMESWFFKYLVLRLYQRFPKIDKKQIESMFHEVYSFYKTLNEVIIDENQKEEKYRRLIRVDISNGPPLDEAHPKIRTRSKVDICMDQFLLSSFGKSTIEEISQLRSLQRSIKARHRKINKSLDDIFKVGS
jgi:Predicted NTPase (NACHT family)